MTITNYDDFREKYGDAIKKLDDVYGRDRLNIFKILRLDDYEIRHSNFLVWLLKADAFRKLFIRECGKIGIESLADNELDIVDVNREDPFKEIDEKGKLILTNDKKTLFRLYGSDEVFKYVDVPNSDHYSKEVIHDITYVSEINRPFHRYIDINIIGHKYTLTIENKVDTGEHDLQCVAYRNYMEHKYGDKKNIFVFLAKKKPEHFNPTDEDSRFYKYIFVDYSQIKTILGKYTQTLQNTSIERKLIEQYIEVITYWEELPSEYQDILKGIGDLSPFRDNEDYNYLLRIASTDAEKYFVRIAHRYCEEEKNKTDTVIKNVLVKIVKDKKLIYSDYGKTRQTNTENKIPYAYAVEIPNVPFIKTVDFTAIDGLNIGIYAGLSSKRSNALLSYINANAEFWGKLEALRDSKWIVSAEYIIGDASNLINEKKHQIAKISCNLDQAFYKKYMKLEHLSCFDRTDNDEERNNKMQKVINCIDCLKSGGIINGTKYNEILNAINTRCQKGIHAVWCVSLIYTLDIDSSKDLEKELERLYKEKTIAGLSIFGKFDVFN